MTDRTIFTAAHLTPESKEKLREEAKRLRMSMSALISKIVDEYLKKERKAKAR
jgi:hypothetical protein